MNLYQRCYRAVRVVIVRRVVVIGLGVQRRVDESLRVKDTVEHFHVVADHVLIVPLNRVPVTQRRRRVEQRIWCLIGRRVRVVILRQ